MMQLANDIELQQGKYKIIRVLGQGGFGITYLAKDMQNGQFVAIKEFFPKDFCDRDNANRVTVSTHNNAVTVEKLKARFFKEAENMAKLDHPGIVSTYKVFKENDTVYFVMEYIEGKSLSEIIKRYGPLDEEIVLDYIIQIGDALSYMHSQKMTHYDVKPANIIVRKYDNTPVLIDFGFSKQYDINGEATSTLMQGTSRGFSPIELYSIGSINTFSPQTDVYSLGATMYYLISGMFPPDATELISKDLPKDPRLSESLYNIISKAMRPNKFERFETAYDFCNALECNDSDDNTRILNDIVVNQPPISIINGHEAIDIGLSVLWATKDIGASDEFKRGECYVWGDPDGNKTKKLRNSWLSRWCTSGPSSNNITNDSKFDTAKGLWGNGWRMPTIAEVKELFDNCEWMVFNGSHIKLFGPNEFSIVMDNRKHWTAESPNGNLQPFSWEIVNDQIQLILPFMYDKSWSDLYYPIRPVADKNK